MPKIADSVVADVTAGENAFMVDGERFPWWISQEGPSARKLAEDLYLVHVTIFSIVDHGNAFHHDGLPGCGYWPQPVLDGVEFPWWISEDGFTYRSSGNDLASLELEFFAKSVEGMPITDEAERPKPWGPFRLVREKIRASGGEVIWAAAE